MRHSPTPLVAALVSLAALPGCAPRDMQAAEMDALTADAAPLHAAMSRVTEIMLDVVTSPPVASRTYAYASIAAYEAVRHARPGFRSLAGQVNELEPVPEPAPDETLVASLAGVIALLTVAEPLVFRGDRVVAYRDSVIADYQERGVPTEVIEGSVAYGTEVGRHVLAWAGTDGIKKARAMPRFEVREEEPGRWRPTPPAYMDGLEPNWAIVRTFALDSPSEFRPLPPHPYDMTEGSAFHDEVLAVYRAVKDATPEMVEIAKFWDCNPFALQAEGHFMFALKKITPGGHWMGITRIAARTAGFDVVRSAEAYARVAMAVADGFISVWDEKYRSVLIRPETVINESIDPAWRPILQTPPFPEYTSGHSVISGAASEVLTALLGEDFEYYDDVEEPFGLPTRWYGSFREAAEEAAISRLYGGIHYPMAVTQGLSQGRKVGAAVVQRIATRGAVAAADDRGPASAPAPPLPPFHR